MKASILIPAYNASAFLEETLNSCIRQGLEHIHEIIVVDDHSEDDTFRLASDFASRHPAFTISVYQNMRKGACSARNFALNKATGEAIQWLDSDDVLGPEKLATHLQLLKAHPNSLICSPWVRFVGNVTTSQYPNQSEWSLLPDSFTPLNWLKEERMMCIHAWLGSKKLYEQIGPWQEGLLINQDGEYFARAISRCETVIFARSATVYYRSGLKQSTSSFQPQKAPSLFATCQSFEKVALSLGDSREVGVLISNKYMDFIYRVYPLVPELRHAAQEKIKTFGKPTLANPVAESFFAKSICKFFGWKALIRIRKLRSMLAS